MTDIETSTSTSTTDNTNNVIPESEFARRRRVSELVDNTDGLLADLAGTYRAFEEAGVPTREWLPLVVGQLPEPHRTKFLSGIDRWGVAMVDGLAGFLRKGGVGFMEAAMPAILGGVISKSTKAGSVIGDALGKIIAAGELVPGKLLPREFADDGVEVKGDGEEDPESTADAIRCGIDDSITAARMRLTIHRLFGDAPKMLLPDGTPDPSQAPALPCHVVLRGSVPPIEGVLSTSAEGGLKRLTPTQVEDKGNRRMKTVLVEQFFDYADVIAVAVQRDVKADTASRIIS